MASSEPAVRTVFFISDHSGVTAETMGHSLLSQFEGVSFKAVTLPFISSMEKAAEVLQRINATAQADGTPPIIFSTLVRDAERELVKSANGLFLDFFDAFLAPLESELGQKSSHALGRARKLGRPRPHRDQAIGKTILRSCIREASETDAGGIENSRNARKTAHPSRSAPVSR